MEDHELVICTDKKETCKNNPDQCQCGDFNCDEKSFELPGNVLIPYNRRTLIIVEQ